MNSVLKSIILSWEAGKIGRKSGEFLFKCDVLRDLVPFVLFSYSMNSIYVPNES